MNDVFIPSHGFRIVSGGQTGADRAALDWALAHGIAHGGWCPRGRHAEDGVVPIHYLLRETPGDGYLQRTRWNVRDSDATLIVTQDESLDGGSRRTALFAARLDKPWLHAWPGTDPKDVARFLARHGVRTLNVAGKRASAAPGVGVVVWTLLSQAIAVPDPTAVC